VAYFKNDFSIAQGLCCKSRRSRRMKVAHRFIGGEPAHNMTESAKRTTERNGVIIASVFQPSASRTEKSSWVRPSAKALGYSHSVRFADAENRLLQQSLAQAFMSGESEGPIGFEASLMRLWEALSCFNPGVNAWARETPSMKLAHQLLIPLLALSRFPAIIALCYPNLRESSCTSADSTLRFLEIANNFRPDRERYDWAQSASNCR